MQLMLSPLSKPYVPPLQSAIVYLVKRLINGRARRITEVQGPESDFGHHRMRGSAFLRECKGRFAHVGVLPSVSKLKRGKKKEDCGMSRWSWAGRRVSKLHAV